MTRGQKEGSLRRRFDYFLRQLSDAEIDMLLAAGDDLPGLLLPLVR